MKNDLQVSKLYKTQRNLMVYLIGIAVVSFVFKFLSGVKIDLKSNLMEFFIIAFSIIFFTIQFCRGFGVPAKDEKMVKEKCIIHKIGFNILLWGGIGVHFISNLIYDQELLLERNSFTSLAILLGLVVVVTTSKRNKSYLNDKIIDQPNKKYYISILKTLGKVALIAIAYATVIYSLSLSLVISFDKVLIILGSICLSLIFFSIEYFMFSIYEKLDYNENATFAEQHKTSFLSKKAILFSLPVIGFNILFAGIWVFKYFIEASGNMLAYQQIVGLLELLGIWHIDFIIIGLFLAFIIYRSIKILPVNKPNLFKYIPILIWISFAYNVIVYIYQTFIIELLNGNNSNFVAITSEIINNLSYVIPIILLAVFAYMYPFLKRNNFPAIKALLILPFIPLITEVAQYYIPSLISLQYGSVYEEYVIRLVSVIVYYVVMYYILCSMSFTEFKIIPQEQTKEVKKVAYSKKLIH